MTDRQPTVQPPRDAAMLAAWARRAAPARWPLGAALAGALVGWLAVGLLVAPPPQASATATAREAVPAEANEAVAAIAVEPLPAPEPTAAPELAAPARVLVGPPHEPAELALLFLALKTVDDSLTEAAPAIPGPPHGGADATLQLLALADRQAAAPRPVTGAPHRPAELYLLLTAGAQASAAAGPTRAGPPHTMPEVYLLHGVLERQRQQEAPAVSVRATGWIGTDNANAPLALLPGRDERPELAAGNGPEAQVPIAPQVPPDPTGAPMIAIMIDDMGLNAGRTRRVAALPGPLTLAFIPYGENLAEQVRMASDAGHEIFLHLPMEPTDPTADPGPHALLAGMAPQALADELAWNLDRFEGYVGVNNHMGSLLTQDGPAMDLVMAELHRRGLVFVDSMTSAASVAYDTALRQGLPAARRDIFLDNVAEQEAILVQLDRLEARARSQGFAIGIGHPHDATIAALALWLPQVEARGLVLVTASRVITSRAPLIARNAGN